MSAPTPYTLTYDFTSFQASDPTTPLPADRIEIEFENISLTTTQIITNLGILQKSDGSLANGIVKVENLATELTIGLESPVSWSNGEAFTVNQTVIEGNKLYRCGIAHVSDVFADDLTAGKWVLVADYASFSTDAETAKDAAELAQSGAEAAEANTVALYDNFDDRYLGAKTTDPSVDNDGDALQTGALYWNTPSVTMRVWSGSAWGDAIGATSLPIFVYTAAGGETSVSGADDNGSTLNYVVGKLQVFVEGVNVTQSVVATDGTSVTGIPALGAGDVVEVYSFQSVAVLNDISSHSIATPVKDDFLLFQDVNDTNRDRRATIGNVLRADGVIAGATSGVITASDEILFSDESNGNTTKKDTVQGIIDLAATPVGAVLQFAGSTAPGGWSLCYGQEVSRTSFSALFAVIGTTYGVGDGSTTFLLPDLRGRVVAGKDDMGGTSADRLTDQSGGVDGDTLGDVGGAEGHELTGLQNGPHVHDGSGLTTSTSGNHNHSYTDESATGSLVGASTGNTGAAAGTSNTSNAGNHTHTITGNTGSAGSGAEHNNVQPTIILNYIIKI